MRLSLILFLGIGFILNLISFYFDNLMIVKFVYKFHFVFIILNMIFFISFIYVILAELKTKLVYEKFFLKFVNSKSSYKIFITLFSLAVIFIIMISGVTVFSGHKCRNNNFDNCLIEQKSLRTIYILNTGIYLFKKNEVFSNRDDNMIYFSALPDRY